MILDVPVPDPHDPTPWQNRGGIWYKRDDLHRHPVYGVNGSKYRAARYLIRKAHEAGNYLVVSAASVKAPQSAIASVLAAEEGMACHVIVGGTTVEKALAKHHPMQVAERAGATFSAIPVGYNPALQKAGRDLVETMGDAWLFPYGTSTPPDATVTDIEEFLEIGHEQVLNLPDEVETLVLPFGSGNTAARVMYALAIHGAGNIKKIVLVGIGPNRYDWLMDRLNGVGVGLDTVGEFPFEIEHIPLHPWFAEYGDLMPETSDGIDMHPTYEGKVVRFLNSARPEWWTRRDGTTGFWIVGGPL